MSTTLIINQLEELLQSNAENIYNYEILNTQLWIEYSKIIGNQLNSKGGITPNTQQSFAQLISAKPELEKYYRQLGELSAIIKKEQVLISKLKLRI